MLPFLSYEVTENDDQLAWITSGGLGTSEMAAIDELLEAVPSEDSTTVAERLREHGFAVILPS